MLKKVIGFIKEDYKETSLTHFLILLIVLGIIADLLLNVFYDVSILQFLVTDQESQWKTNWSIRGQWGDALSGHFSALAFMAVAYSIFLQRQDIKQEREYENFKLNLDVLKDLDDKMNEIKNINFNLKYVDTPNKTYHKSQIIFQTLEDFSDAINTSDFFTDVAYEKNKFRIEILYRFKYFFSAIDTINILTSSDTNQKYIDVLNSKLDQYKTIFSYLLRIFIFLHPDEMENTKIFEKLTDSTYKKLLRELAKINSDDTLKEKHLILLEKFKKEYLSINRS